MRYLMGGLIALLIAACATTMNWIDVAERVVDEMHLLVLDLEAAGVEIKEADEIKDILKGADAALNILRLATDPDAQEVQYEKIRAYARELIKIVAKYLNKDSPGIRALERHATD